MDDVKRLNKELFHYPLKYSICTIVNDLAEYEIMKNSFIEKGFTHDCEYIIADNSNGNVFDAYEAISRFLKVGKGEFLVIVHQDVRLIDDIKKLDYCLKNLEEKDNKWAVCGNAGVVGYHEPILHITHESHADYEENLPKKIKSLDENLLILKSSSNITISPNLKGFHLYGTDLCIIANFLGYNAYVIEFMVLHLSKGNISSLKKQQHEFIEKYGEKMKIGYMQTTCTQFYLSNSKSKNKLFNSSIFFFVFKQFVRYPFLWKKWVKWAQRKKRRLFIIYNYLFKKN